MTARGADSAGVGARSSLDDMTEGAPPALATDNALFLDFDGTLARIVDDPDAVALEPGAKRALLRVSARLQGAVAILSGRDVRDLARRAPAGVWRIGGHGVEVCPPKQGPLASSGVPPPRLVDAAEALVAAHPGARLEVKGPIVAIHFRRVPEAGQSLGAALRTVLTRIEGYKLQAGKMVVEAKPLDADKGLAVARAMERPPFRGRAPVMVGDDATDEDAFVVAQALGGYGVKVGEGATLAAHRLASTEDVLLWLEGRAA